VTMPSVKDEVRQLIERLPDDATWEDVEYQIYFRRAVEAGLRESEAGRVVPAAEIRRRFGLGMA